MPSYTTSELEAAMNRLRAARRILDRAAEDFAAHPSHATEIYLAQCDEEAAFCQLKVDFLTAALRDAI